MDGDHVLLLVVGIPKTAVLLGHTIVHFYPYHNHIKLNII